MSSSMSWGLDAAKTGGQLFQSTELNTRGKQDKFLSFHQLLSTLEWGKLVTQQKAVYRHQTTSDTHPSGGLYWCVEIHHKLNSLTAVTSHAVRPRAFSRVTHLLLAQAAIGKRTCPLFKGQSPPSNQSHPAKEEDAFPTSKTPKLGRNSISGYLAVSLSPSSSM